MVELKFEFKECTTCSGSGRVSNCCNVLVLDNSDICSSCLEHCDLEICTNCDGEGEVPKSYDDWTDAQNAIFEKADMKYKLKKEL